jgi:hypothetical protein
MESKPRFILTNEMYQQALGGQVSFWEKIKWWFKGIWYSVAPRSPERDHFRLMMDQFLMREKKREAKERAQN